MCQVSHLIPQLTCEALHTLFELGVRTPFHEVEDRTLPRGVSLRVDRRGSRRSRLVSGVGELELFDQFQHSRPDLHGLCGRLRFVELEFELTTCAVDHLDDLLEGAIGRLLTHGAALDALLTKDREDSGKFPPNPNDGVVPEPITAVQILQGHGFTSFVVSINAQPFYHRCSKLSR